MSRTVEDITYDLRDVATLLDTAESVLHEMDFGPPEDRNRELEQIRALSKTAHKMLDALTDELEKVR